MVFDNLSFGLALVAGLVSFLSPCVLSLVSVYLGYLGSRAVTPGGAAVASRWDTFSHGLAFVLGFSAVFVALGMTATALGAFLFDIRGLLTRVGGVAVIVLWLHTMGLFRLGFLDVDMRAQRPPDRRFGYASSALMGVFFSAGWSPCVGPVLGAVLTLAFNADDLGRGAWLLVAYSIGLGIPFLLAAVWAGQFSAWLRRYGHLRRYAGPLAGGFLVLLAGGLWLERRGELSGQGGDVLREGRRAPAIELATLDGGTLSLAEQRGEVVIVNLWASWCGPCRAEMPALQRLYAAERARGLVEIGDDARAYLIQVLMWHEIANDSVGGVPVAVTFCPLCNTAIVFDRRVGERTLDFGTTGRLRYSNLIMYDRQTESWWQQASGEGIAGEFAGAQLTFLPTAIIAWEEFVGAYPDGQVLSRETGFSRNYGQNPYQGYDDVNRPPFLYDGSATPDALPATARVLTVDLDLSNRPLCVQSHSSQRGAGLHWRQRASDVGQLPRNRRTTMATVARTQSGTRR